MRQTYMILGGNGLIGVQLTRYLLQNVPDVTVICIGRNPEKPPAYSLYRGTDASRYAYHQIHITHESEKIRELFEATHPAVVVNLAAQSESSVSWKDSWRYFETNNVALAKIVEPLIGVDSLKKWVQIGSGEVYGSLPNPATEESPMVAGSPYSASKAAADLYLLSLASVKDFPLNIIRPSSVYGPGQKSHRIVPRAVLCALTGEKFPLEGDGTTRKGYLHTDDLARAIHLVAEKGALGEIYNVGAKEGHSAREVIALVCEKTGVPLNTLVNLVPDRPGQGAQYLLNSTKMEKLGWRPERDLSKGIDGMIVWAKEHLDFLKTQPTRYTVQA